MVQYGETNYFTVGRNDALYDLAIVITVNTRLFRYGIYPLIWYLIIMSAGVYLLKSTFFL